MDKRRKLIEVAMEGVTEYLKSEEGVRLFGEHPRIFELPFGRGFKVEDQDGDVVQFDVSTW